MPKWVKSKKDKYFKCETNQQKFSWLKHFKLMKYGEIFPFPGCNFLLAKTQIILLLILVETQSQWKKNG